MSASSSELIDRGDVNELLFHVNALVADQDWAGLDDLRELCRRAFERGKQLWSVSDYIEYRVCLEGPGQWAALMLETGKGRFALGPLPEVAASSHTWDELSPHLHGTPGAAMVAHERVLRGEDLSHDEVASSLPEVLDLPLRLQEWEPVYALAQYHADRVEAPPPKLPPLRPVPGSEALPVAPTPGQPVGGLAPGGRGGLGEADHAVSADEVSGALEELVTTWTEESNGRAEAISVQGTALDAIRALGRPPAYVGELDAGEAVALMAWAAADGGAHGRRRGAAPGRFAAWWVLASLGGLGEQFPLAAQELGHVVQGSRWYHWASGEPDVGWAMRLAVEVERGPRSGRAWAVSALDSD